MKTAAARPVPIPVYAEMSSINPVFVFEGVLNRDLDEFAKAYVTSVTGSSGQLCTAPGLIFIPRGSQGDALVDAISRATTTASGQTMLTRGIAESWNHGVSELESQERVSVVVRGQEGATENAPAPAIFASDVPELLQNDVLHAEIFGAASLIIRYDDAAQLVQSARGLEGQLTATLHLEESDYETVAPLIPVLEEKVGRILANGWPTGVEVGHAMVHGGPFPATSDSRTTSVGTLAIDRFLRPVAYQNLPEALLPKPLQDANPWNVNRRVDGDFRKVGA